MIRINFDLINLFWEGPKPTKFIKLSNSSSGVADSQIHKFSGEGGVDLQQVRTKLIWIRYDDFKNKGIVPKPS